ncbi:LPP20 family lipoprotein [Thermodesulfobacteriota bacterium]
MRKKSGTRLFFIFLLATVMMIGCAGKAKDVAPESTSTRPEWVDKGSGAFEGEMGKVFYGVGMAWGAKNPVLLRSSADSKARAEIASIFNVYVARLNKSHAESAMEGDPDTTSELQYITETVKTFTKAELAGVQIVDHWKDEKEGVLYSLGRMDYSIFESYLDKGSQLSEAARQRVVNAAKAAFTELEEEEAKHE